MKVIRPDNFVYTPRAYYVYAHLLNNELIYIGIGKKPRPFKICKKTRNRLWWSLIREAQKDRTKENELKVDILKLFFSKTKAMKYEAKMIKELSPKCNVIHKIY